MAKQLVLLGAPGSGKGTQAARLVSEKSYKHLSTGDLFRAVLKSGSELGNKIQKIIDAGNLVDDKTTLELLASNCDLSSGTYIFDGYPRNLDQAKSLDEVILKGAEKQVLYFKVNVDDLVKRLTNRRSCKDCGEIYNLLTKAPGKEGACDKCGGELQHRKDDNEEVIRNRMDVFTKTIEPMLNYYESQGVLRTLDASNNIDAVYEEVEASLA